MAILSLDQGTTSSRAILFSQSGEVLGLGQVEFEQFFPKPGWVEHDPEEIWQSQLKAITIALNDAEMAGADIEAIGITNQRETTVVWNRETGLPVYNAIVWQDSRTAQYCDSLKEKEEAVSAKTGLLLDPYFSASKVRWILDHVTGAMELAEQGQLAFGTVESWLVWKLTDGEKHVSDVSNASRTLLLNLARLDWDDDMLEMFAIPRSMLPQLVSNSEVVGKTAVFETEIPIAGLIGDQQAALFGQLCLEKGAVKNTYGTGCFMLMNTGENIIQSKKRLLTTVAWKRGEEVHYALEGSVFDAGSVVKWLRDGLGIIQGYKELEQLVRSVESNQGVYFAPAFSGFGAPHWDPYARGLIGGLTRAASKAHIARAAVESIAFQVDQVLAEMRADSGQDIVELRVDGGVSVSDFLLQFQSDVSGLKVMRTATPEATALGAAFMAGLAVGYWNSVDDLRVIQDRITSFDAGMSDPERNELKAGWHKAVLRALQWNKT